MQASTDSGSTPIQINLYEDVIMGSVKIIEQTFRVALPGLTTSWDHDTMRWSGDAGTRFIGMDRQPREEPGMQGIPLIMPRGGGYGVHFDLRPADPVLVLACDGPVRGYYETGQPVTPDIGVGHQYGTAVAFPGGKVSSSEPGQASPPPNDPGTCWAGAEDGTATIQFSGKALPNPAELGSVVISTAGPSASLKLGSGQAVLGVARLTDTVGPSEDMIAFISAIAAFANGLVPGTVPPNVLLALIGPVPPGQIGIITSASQKVVADD